MTFLNAIFWEYIQNAPVIVFFAAAVWFWAQGRKRQALVCMIIGAVSGALVIRYTESLKIMRAFMEPVSVTAVNAIVFSLIQLPFAAYLGTQAWWSNWKTDLMGGGITGGLVAIAQGLAATTSPLIGVILHSVALTMTGGLVLIGIRMLKGKTLTYTLVSSLLIVLFMTLIISLIDYSYLFIFE